MHSVAYFKFRGLRLAIVDCIARVVLSFCIALAAAAVLIGAVVMLAGGRD